MSGVTGQPTVIKSIHFTPLELFGAAARCSHTSFVNPAISSPESQMIASLVEQYVDDTTSDFAILSTADKFKDFVKSYFTGTVAAGLAYLAMVELGYQWVDHFENIVGGNPNATRSPDFVFSGTYPGNALLESKGTRQAGKSTFDSTVEAGYLGQVEPHLGHQINGINASHGYCIGSWLTSTAKAEMFVHHTAASQQGGGADDRSGANRIQQNNYATAFHLAQSPELGGQLRLGLVQEVPQMIRFRWLDKSWITSGASMPRWDWEFFGWRHFPPSFWRDEFPRFPPRFVGFAIEESIATAVIRRFYGSPESSEHPLAVEPIPDRYREEARRRSEGTYGAVFPDGLAIIGRSSRIKDIEPVRWTDGEFE